MLEEADPPFKKCKDCEYKFEDLAGIDVLVKQCKKHEKQSLEQEQDWLDANYEGSGALESDWKARINSRSWGINQKERYRSDDRSFKQQINEAIACCRAQAGKGGWTDALLVVYNKLLNIDRKLQ